MLTQSVNLITLGVDDLAAARGFYERLGWRVAEMTPTVVFFQLQGQVLGLFGRKDLASDQGRPGIELGTGATTLAKNFGSPGEVDLAFELALSAGATPLKRPEKVFWGGYSGYWADLDGHVWEMAFNPFWPLAPDGRITLPGQIEKIAEMDLSGADERQIVDLLAGAFRTDFGGRSFFQTRHHLRLCLREGGQIIAHMALQYRSLRQGGKRLDIVGLADVATHPDHRGRGLAARLLAAAITEARRSPAKFFLLFGTAKLYEAAGFQPARNALTYVDFLNAGTGQIRFETESDLRVLELSDEPWDHCADLDLVGGVF